MTDSIGTYAFDLQREAEDMLAGLGERGKKMLVIETSVTPYAQDGAPRIDFGCIMGDEWLKQKYLPKFQGHIEDTFASDQGKGTYCAVMTTRVLRKLYAYICFDRKTQFSGQLGEENRSLMDLFTLYHEAAHGLTHKRYWADSPAYKECLADAYAALRLLQRFGTAAAPFLSQVSWLRANNAVGDKDTDHLTTTVLDKIVLDSARRDFAQLTPEETVRLAKGYANALTPKPSALRKAGKIFEFVSKNMPDVANVISASTLKYPVDDFSFYILSKYASLFQEGRLDYGGKRWKPEDAQNHARIQSEIEARLSTLRLHDVFNKKALTPQEAAAPLATALKVYPSPGQDRFAYQPKKFSYRA